MVKFDVPNSSWTKNYEQNYQSNPDPFNWKKIAADLKAEEDRKAAARRRTQAASIPQPVAQEAAPAPTVKELLDAYRAMNNGALPPGTTPEMAAMIDQGIWTDWSMLEGNPQLAQALLGFQAAIGALPAEYQAAKARVAGDYENLTGDVLTSGKNWMQDLYGRMVDPNDPNSALVAQDPALTNYAQTMSQIDETADLNQATDMAWFDKMLQNQLANYQMTMRTAGLDPGLAAGSGGGGGGGGGRGGGGGGGGNSSEWKTPTNTLTNLQSATDTATGTSTEYSPGFYEALIAASEGDPELEALTQRMWETSSQNPLGMTQDVAKALTAAEIEQEQQTAQTGLAETWKQLAPAQVQAAMRRMLSNKGATPTEVPRDYASVIKARDYSKNPAAPRKNYVVPNAPGQNTSPIIQFSEKQMEENALGEELMNALDTVTMPQHGTSWFRSPEAIETVKKPAQTKLLAQRGMEKLLEAQKGDTPETPFNWQGWAASGGYVPEVSKEASGETERNIGFYNRILDAILPWNPNANLVQTRNQLVNQGKDQSSYQSKNTNKSFGNALAGSPLDLSPGIPQSGILSNPLSNPGGFDITTDESGDETVEPRGGPGTQVTGFRMPTGARLPDLSKLAANRLRVVPAKVPSTVALSGAKTGKKEKPKSTVALSGAKTGKKVAAKKSSKGKNTPRAV